jgi:single-stranded DNA-specific DHH superfamily exonuclease
MAMLDLVALATVADVAPLGREPGLRAAGLP